MLKHYRDKVKQQQRKLVEGITHLEELPLDKFVNAIENIDRYVATEKLDGYNLWFGFDEQGFFTSRGAKGGQTFRTVDDFDDRPAYNSFRAVHAALEQCQDILKRHVQEGEIVEIEILYGRQPNAIVYGRNMIAFLRYVHDGATEHHIAKLDQLADALDGKSVTTTTSGVTTTDGLDLNRETLNLKWTFVRPSQIESSVLRQVNITSDVEKLKAFLNASNSRLPEYTNRQIATANLNRIPMSLRDDVKLERSIVQDLLAHDFVLPIKHKLINKLLRTATPSLRTVDVQDGEDVGIEGIVFLDPETNEQFKLVDKDAFTAINKFNFAVRSALKTTGMAKNPFTHSLGISDDASVFDQYTTRLARIFGIAQTLKYYEVRRVLQQLGSTPQEIIDRITTQCNSLSVRDDVLHAIAEADKELKVLLVRFKRMWKQYHHKLPSGKTVRYTPEVYRRTLTSFAELHQEFIGLYRQVKQATTTPAVIAIVFSKQLQVLAK